MREDEQPCANGGTPPAAAATVEHMLCDPRVNNVSLIKKD